MVMSRQTPSGAPRVFVRRAALAATGALLLLSGVSAQDDGVQSATRDMEIASMNAVQGGLSAAAEDLPRINTAASTQQQSALEAVRSNLGAHPAFQEFVQKHKGADHSYCPNLGNDEPCIEALRRELSFVENQGIIEAHNSQPGVTFKMGQTPYADYSAAEFKAKVLKYSNARTLTEKRAEKASRETAASRAIPGVTSESRLGQRNVPISEYPKQFDWAAREEVMGKIHTQKTSCASCWAYSSTDTIEAQAVISGRREKHVELSAEQLINCDGYDSGCNTGNMFTAFEWIHENGGLATARAFHGAAAAAARTGISATRLDATRGGEDDDALGDYENNDEGKLGVYHALELGVEDERRELDSIESGLVSSNGNCPVNLHLVDRVFGYCELDFDAGEEALMAAVSRHPVAVGINADKVFQLYASGIISSEDCGPAPHTAAAGIMAINHAVVVTGWGEEIIGGRRMKYWILKNSFGEGWGENGYFKLERGSHTLDQEGFGTCGLYFESVYPVLDESAGSSACVPGSTFRTKYYSAASAAGLGVNAARESVADVFLGKRGMAVASVVGMVFAGGLVASVIAVSARRVTRWSGRAAEETSALIPH